MENNRFWIDRRGARWGVWVEHAITGVPFLLETCDTIYEAEAAMGEWEAAVRRSRRARRIITRPGTDSTPTITMVF